MTLLLQQLTMAAGLRRSDYSSGLLFGRRSCYVRIMVTLRDMTRSCADVGVHCKKCAHFAVVPAAELIAKLGEQFVVADLGPKCRCQRCGHLGAEARPHYDAGLGVIASHEGMRTNRGQA